MGKRLDCVAVCGMLILLWSKEECLYIRLVHTELNLHCGMQASWSCKKTCHCNGLVQTEIKLAWLTCVNMQYQISLKVLSSFRDETFSGAEMALWLYISFMHFVRRVVKKWKYILFVHIAHHSSVHAALSEWRSFGSSVFVLFRPQAEWLGKWGCDFFQGKEFSPQSSNRIWGPLGILYRGYQGLIPQK